MSVPAQRNAAHVMAGTPPYRRPLAPGFFVDYPGVPIGLMTRLSFIDRATGDPRLANEEGSV
jgi:hypothetical protein